MRHRWRTVRSGAERTSRSGEHDDVDRTVEFSQLERVRDAVVERVVERVQPVRSIQRDETDAPCIADKDVRFVHEAHPTLTTALPRTSPAARRVRAAGASMNEWTLSIAGEILPVAHISVTLA